MSTTFSRLAAGPVHADHVARLAAALWAARPDYLAFRGDYLRFLAALGGWRGAVDATAQAIASDNPVFDVELFRSLCNW